MQFSRRTFVASGALIPLATFVRPVSAQVADSVPVDGMTQFDAFPDGFGDGLFRSSNPNKNFGSTPPPAVYAAIGSTILRGAPFNCRPIEVAYYFANLREGKLPSDVMVSIDAIARQAGQAQLAQPNFLKFFAYDWEANNYYNPVVIGFFRGNGLRPYAGDQTPWCAAFANWCISRSRAQQPGEIIFGAQTRTFGTMNASSGSFRCWGTNATADPKEGDVIVWAKAGTVTENCPAIGQGHVAFLTGIEKGSGGQLRYHVVGGNQGYRGNAARSVEGGVVRPQDVAQAVSRRVIGRSFGDRVIHSIRTQSYLR